MYSTQTHIRIQCEAYTVDAYAEGQKCGVLAHNVCVVLVEAHTKGEISMTTLSFCVGRLRVYFKRSEGIMWKHTQRRSEQRRDGVSEGFGVV